MLAPAPMWSTCPGGPRPPSAGRAARNRTGCRSRTRRARWVPYPGAASARARLRPHGCACSTAWARQVGQVPGQAAGRGGAEVVFGADGADRGYEGVRRDHIHHPRPKYRPPLRTASDLSTCRAPASGAYARSHQCARVRHNGHKGWAGTGPDTSEGVPCLTASSRSAALATSWAQRAEFPGQHDEHVWHADGVAGGAGALRGRRGGGRDTWRTDPHHLHRRHVPLSLLRSCERHQSYPPRYGAPLPGGDCSDLDGFSGKK